MMVPKLIPAALAVALGICTMSALVATASAAPPSFAPGANASASPADVKLLPASIKSRGTLNAATTDGNAPWSFVEAATNTAKGVDIDLVDAAAKRLGVNVKWSDVQFPAGIPGVQSGRYDLYVSAMADTKAREKVVNFIAYSREGSGVIVLKGNPQHITTLKDLCGKRVSIVTGSLFPEVVAKLNVSCKRPVILSQTADQTGPLLAVASGQADATMNTYGVSSYLLKTATGGVQTRLELSPVPLFAPANQGIAFSKSQTDLMAALAGALQGMVADGTYEKIMQKWNVAGGSVPHILINAPLF